MRNYVIFNDFNTSSYALIEELPVVDKPERNIEFIEIEGRHGFLTFDKGNYKPIEYSITLVFKDKQKRDIVNSKFQGSGKLILSNEVDRFYKATVVNTITYERQTRDVYACNISFRLQPFAYELDSEYETRALAFRVINDTNTTAQPIIEVYGTGSGMLYINDETIQIKEIGGCTILNFELKEAYSSDGTSQNTQVLTDYDDLPVGDISFSWDGGITKINILYNWRWL